LSWRLGAGLLCVAILALKAYQWYFSRTLWLDEEMILLNVRDRQLSELFAPLWLNQTAPIGWLVLQHWIVTAFGSADRAVRASSVVFGMATVATALWVSTRWMKPAGAILFLLLCGITQWMAFYALEAKHYAADAFWALLLPAMAAWATEPTRERALDLRRTALWWITAAVGQWFAYGAIFVTPGCAALLGIVAWIRGRGKSLLAVGSQGAVWLVCFLLHYQLGLRHASQSTYLRDYWHWGFPPDGAGVGTTVTWLWGQLEPLARHPGGTAMWATLWLTILYGFATSMRKQPVFASAMLIVPVSVFVLGAFRIVPLADRLALWMVPALYAGIAMTADDAVDRIQASVSRRQWLSLGLALLVGAMTGRICFDLLETGRSNLLLRTFDNHSLNDRSAVRFLMIQRQPGDVFLANHFGLPAVWWYGDISIADPDAGSTGPQDGAPLLEVRHVWPGPGSCRTDAQNNELRDALVGARRASVYLGFEARLIPGFQELVLDKLSELGSLIAYRQFGTGVAAVFDLRLPSKPWGATIAGPGDPRAKPVIRPDGCLGVKRARRW
jgi:hypothetical protein